MQLGMKHCGRFTDRRVGGPGLWGGGRAQLHPRDNPVRAPHSSQVSGFAAASSGARTGQGTETRRQAEEALPSQTPRGRWVRGTGTRGARPPRSPPRLRRPPWVPTRAPALRGRITRVPPDAGEPRAALRPDGSSRPFPGGGGVSWRETKTTSFLRLAKRPPKRQQPPSTRGRAPPAAHASLPRPASHRERTRGQRQPAVMNPT